MYKNSRLQVLDVAFWATFDSKNICIFFLYPVVCLTAGQRRPLFSATFPYPGHVSANPAENSWVAKLFDMNNSNLAPHGL